MQRILVLRGGALGDFLVTLPALHLLRQRWPQARLELSGNATAGELGRSAGLLDAVHSQHEARWSELHRAGPLSHSFADWLGGFDLVLNYWPDADGTLRRHFPLRPGQTFLTAAAWPEQAPAAAHYCEPLRTLGLAATDYHYRLHLAHPGSGQTATVTVRPIAIHPGSGSPRKNWPLESWTRLCRELLQRAPKPELLIVTGEAEPDDTLAALGARARQLPLPELAARLAGCRLFLGHDSGVSHLAAALGVPSVLLFGPTDPAMWAPPGPHVHVIQRGADLAAISVDEVVAAVGM